MKYLYYNGYKPSLKFKDIAIENVLYKAHVFTKNTDCEIFREYYVARHIKRLKTPVLKPMPQGLGFRNGLIYLKRLQLLFAQFVLPFYPFSGFTIFLSLAKSQFPILAFGLVTIGYRLTYP